MTPALYVVVTDAVFAGIVDPQIENHVSMGGFTGYITYNLTPPSPTLYVARLNANGSFIVSQSKQPGFTTVLQTFLGWAIPA